VVPVINLAWQRYLILGVQVPGQMDEHLMYPLFLNDQSGEGQLTAKKVCMYLLEY
jgi:hypothetical protein